MAKSGLIRGVLSPVLTPFRRDLSPDPERLIKHCKWLLRHDVGLAVFGTNSEGNSLCVDEKKVLLGQLINAGIDPKRMMPGTGACALPDAVALTKECVRLGCGGVLALPPFYYKDITDDGIFKFYAEVIERVGNDRLRVYLYHIPPVARVPVTMRVIERLLKAYPGTVVGIKDSGNDWAHTDALIRNFAPHGFQVFAGSESFLLRTLHAGGAGCITATANVSPGPITDLYNRWQDPDADNLQSSFDRVRGAFAAYPMIAAMKAARAHYGSDLEWDRLRPPLVSLPKKQQQELIDRLDDMGFKMEGL